MQRPAAGLIRIREGLLGQDRPLATYVGIVFVILYVTVCDCMSVFKFESDRKNVFWQTLMVTPTTSIIFDEARDAVQRLAQLKCSQAVLEEAQKSVIELCSNSQEPSMFLTHEEFA